MIIIDKPDTAYLHENYIDEVAQENPDWVKNYLKVLAGELMNDPTRYLGYGPYWWLMKHELIAAGHWAFGKYINKKWFAYLDYGNAECNVAAAYDHFQWALQSGYLYSSNHPYYYRDTEQEKISGEDEIWETADYALDDPNMLG